MLKSRDCLLADYYNQPLISIGEAIQGIVISACRADEHDVIARAAEEVTELVH